MAFEEVMGESLSEKDLGNWRESDPCYVVAITICKVEVVAHELGDSLASEMSRQEGRRYLLASSCCLH